MDDTIRRTFYRRLGLLFNQKQNRNDKFVFESQSSTLNSVIGVDRKVAGFFYLLSACAVALWRSGKRQAAQRGVEGREIAPLATGAQLRDSGSYSLKTLSNSTNVKKNKNNNAASLLSDSFCAGRPRIYLQVSSFMITILNSVLLSVLCTYLLWVL